MEGKVCINNKINHVVSCIYVETIAEPINTIISREHGVKHEILEISEIRSGEEVCFVHAIIMTQIAAKINGICATSPTGFLPHQNVNSSR